MSEKNWEGPIYDLMRAYSQLTYGNMTPRVEAGYEARKWVHRYAREHFSFPHCENRYGDSVIERGDVLEDTFKFSLGGDMKDRLMNSYRERMSQMFADKEPPPNLEPIYVVVPVGGKIYVDHATEEGRKAWSAAHPIERWLDQETGKIFLIRKSLEYIAEVEQMAAQETE